jgi:two-component system, NarL family, sensor histidine kinase UhpB
MDTVPAEHSRRSSCTRRDMILIIVVSVAAVIVFANLNLSEALFAWTRPLERFQLDELPFVLLVVAVSLIWFSLRRYREAQREVLLRRLAERKLASALEDNRRLGQQYIHSQESERKTLARDLHDEMGQYLNVIKLDAVSIRAATAAGDPLVHELTCSVIQNVDRVYRVVTGLIRQLRPVALDELGLAPALHQCIVDWRRRLPTMTIELSICGDFEALDESRALTLFRLAQEALTNIARHSAATRVDIKMSRESKGPPPVDACTVVIEDNGIGTDLERRQSGLGLIGMRERLSAIGGSLTIRSSPGNGFGMTAYIPIAPPT